MRPHAVSLDDQELWLVQQAAKLLPPEIRDWFLRRVADELGNICHPARDDVHEAITRVLATVNMTLPLYLDR